jgi:hypothetical protein
MANFRKAFRRFLRASFLVFFFLFLGSSGDASVVIYPGPSGITSPSDYSVKVNGQPLFVYPITLVDKNGQPPTSEIGSMVYFDFSGSVTVEIASSRPVNRVDIRPRSYRIVPTVSGNIITFTLSEPRKVSVELNGDWHLPLFVMTNPIESNIPSPTDPNVLYFGPGLHRPGTITPRSSQMVYIAGGAVVRGRISVDNVQNVTIRGRGILDGSETTQVSRLLPVNRSTGVVIKDIFVVDANRWHVPLFDSNNINISNLKIFGWRVYGDGIDIVDSKNVTVNDCFIRTWDDNITVKAISGYQTPKNINVSGCVLWSDRARSLMIGDETSTDLISDIAFKDSDIIRNRGYYGPLDIRNSDRALVRDVSYEDIRIENTNTLVQLTVENTIWSKDSQRGNISNIYFKNISFTGSTDPPSVIKGYDSGHTVSNVTFENLRMRGKVILNPSDGNFTIGPYASNINFIAGGGPTPTPITFCHLYDSATGVPTSGFGAAWNVLSSAKEVLLKAVCNTSSADFAVGNGASTQYIYNKGYYWTGTQWSQFTLDCSSFVYSSWCIGDASHTHSISSTQLANTNYYVAYVCSWTASTWKCGCADTSCTTGDWQLQAFKKQ